MKEGFLFGLSQVSLVICGAGAAGMGMFPKGSYQLWAIAVTIAGFLTYISTVKNVLEVKNE